MHNSKGISVIYLCKEALRKQHFYPLELLLSQQLSRSIPNPTDWAGTEEPQEPCPAMSFPRSAIPHARLRPAQNNCNVCCSIPINILQTCQGLNQPPVKISLKVLSKLTTLPLLLWLPLRQWEVPGKEALKPSIHLFLHLSAILKCKFNPIIDLPQRSPYRQQSPIYSCYLTSL